MLQVRFFARTRDELGCSALDVAWAEEIASLDALQEQLCVEGGERWRQVLTQDNMIRAVNHTVVEGDCPLAEGDEIAFFPPVTGG
jgi:molybdopterin synthase sulfur carrier subunit